MLLYLLIQYLEFQFSAVYHGLENKLKIKQINGS
jgi:hypothetical protein